jgi:hypothetical protein
MRIRAITDVETAVGDATTHFYWFRMPNGRVVGIGPIDGQDHAYEPESSEPKQYTRCPVHTNLDIWFYRGHAVFLDDAASIGEDEVKLRVKHAVLSKEKELRRVAREVEAYESMDKVADAKPERIPDSVRLFVWQRDEGKCVRCGSSENLEFDHIIPVAKGGASTERNVRLLCETCNRAKRVAI